MKNINSFRLVYLLALPLFLIGCDDDETVTKPVDFAGIASSYSETEGTKSVILPLRNVGSAANNLSVTFDGTATEGEDFQLVGITAEGVEISMIDDDDFELNETVRVMLTRSGAPLAGNALHTVTILSQCDDAEGLGNALSLVSDLEGVDGNLDLYGYPAHGDITVKKDADGNYTIEGLNVDFMQEVWGEEVLEQVPVVLTMGANGAFTIADQYIFTTLFDGAEYEYHIVGSGQLDPCNNALVIDYEMIQDGFEVGAWLHANGFMTDPIFKGTFELGL